MNLVCQVEFHLARTNLIWPRSIHLDKSKCILLQTRPVVPVCQMNWDVPDYTHIWVHLGSPGTSGATQFSRCYQKDHTRALDPTASSRLLIVPPRIIQHHILRVILIALVKLGYYRNGKATALCSY